MFVCWLMFRVVGLVFLCWFLVCSIILVVRSCGCVVVV